MKRTNDIDLIAYALGSTSITNKVSCLIEAYTPLADYYSREHAVYNTPRDHLVYMLRRLYRACMVYHRTRRDRAALAYKAVNNCYVLLLRETLISLGDSPRVSIHQV